MNKNAIKKSVPRFIFLSSILLVTTAPAHASSEPEISISLTVVWLAICAAMVFFMQAGFALLESGMSRSKNSINVIMKNYSDVCVGIIVFWLIGYGLMYGNKFYGIIGTDLLLSADSYNDVHISMVYQMMFAATAATIVSGAAAERMRYWPYVAGAAIVTGIIYPISGGWIWGGSETEGYGWLNQLGFIDLAGSTVVHSVGGWCALAVVIVLGPRTGRFGLDGAVRNIPGHNLHMVSLGGLILWFGWFGFNAGSGEIKNAGLVLLNTQLAAAAGAVGSVLYMVLTRRPVLMTSTVFGAIGGLVASCAGAATMEPTFALVTGLVAGSIVVFGEKILLHFQIDDVVSAVPVHGMCGAWGTLAAGMFHAGDLFNTKIILVQIFGILAVFTWAFFASLCVFGCIDRVVGLRASKLHEQRGLDHTEHSETGYSEFQNLVTHR